MNPDLMPLPAAEPTVLIVDASPLIHLAMVDALRQSCDESPVDPRSARMTDDERLAILRLYADGSITVTEAADRLGPGTAVVDVILETRERLRRLPDRRDAFTEGEYRRALTMLGLDRKPGTD